MACTANKVTDSQVPTKKRKLSDEEVKVCNNKSNADDCKNSNKSNNCNKITGIWELHSYCYRQKLELPKYKIIETTDFSNNKLFIVQCIIRSLHAKATGKKKKEAKHKASHLLLELLKHNEKLVNIINDDEDSLEEGEIDDLEEGEIKENEKSTSDNIICDDIESLLKHKYKSYKIYVEGNIKKDNTTSGSNDPIKSNVECLAEFCFEQKLPPPRYEITKFTGLTSFIFSCKCSVLQLMMKTNGASKGEAKEKVSLMLLNKMKQHIDIINPDNKVGESEKDVDLEEGEILEDGKDDRKRLKLQIPRAKKFKFNESNEQKVRLHIAGMGELYTYCLKLKVPPPIYTITEKYDVSPTKTIFTCKCNVLNFSKFGKGLNKKQAKHAAAKIVLQKLQNWKKTSCQDDNENDLLEDGELTTKEVQVKEEYVKHKLETNFISYEEKSLLQLQCIADRHNVIKSGTPYIDSGIIKKLKEADDEFLKKHAIVILNHLCKELDCNYSFVELKSPTCNITTLFINSVPPWSTFGRGDSLLEAQVESAAKLLKFFKNMSI